MGPPPGMGPSPGANDQMALISVGLGGAATLLGCLSIACCVGYISVPLGIGALVTGFMFMQKQKENPHLGGKNLAIAGMALGGLGIVLPVIAIILGLVLGIGNGMMQQFNH
jgi:hypothetical protein